VIPALDSVIPELQMQGKGTYSSLKGEAKKKKEKEKLW
jgi:hypothetical protein